MNLDLYRFRLSIVQEIRSFFNERNFLELDTPLLAPACIPESSIPLFRTLQLHPWEEARMLHLLPSPEYYIKQLLAGGWGSVFQLAKSFRNGENSGRIHAPEFTMLEYYGEGMDYMDSIDLTEELFSRLMDLALDSPRGINHRVSGSFVRIRMAEAFSRYAGVDLEEFCGDDSPFPGSEDMERARKQCRELDLDYSDRDDWESLFNRIFLNLVEPELESGERPLILYDYPAKLQSLSKNRSGTPWTERWELYWQGIELANCFTEENDRDRIENFFRHEIAAMRGHQDEDLQTNPDPEFPARIAGLPECSGTALGLDRLIMLLAGRDRIEDVMLFPLN